MIINKNSINSILLYLVLFLTVAFFAILPFRNVSYRHFIVFMGTAVFIAIVLKAIFTNTLALIDFLSYIFILLLIMLSAFKSQTGVDVDLVYSIICFITTFVLFSFGKSTFILTKKNEQIVLLATIIISLFIIVASRTSIAYVFEDGRNSGSLALGMTNPNLAAMMLCCVYCVLMMEFRKNKKQYALIPIMAYLLYLIYLTKARTSIIGALIVTAYALFLYRIAIPNLLIVLSIIFPIFVVPVYLGLFRLGVSNRQFIGKQLFSGREITYLQHINHLSGWQQYLYGNLGGERFSNAHNAPLSILCSIGLLGLIVTYIGYIRRMVVINNNATTDEARVAIVCVLSVFIQSSAESLMFTGYFTCMTFLYLYLLIASGNKQNQ